MRSSTSSEGSWAAVAGHHRRHIHVGVDLDPAYTQTHTLGDNYGKSLTLQVGAPYRTGAAASHTILGAKVTSAEFACAVNEIASATVNFDAKAFDDAQVLATASYLSTNVFHGKQMAVKLGTYSSEAAITGVTQWSQTWTRSMDTNDYTADCRAEIGTRP